jgi:hypothetical protein
VTSRGLGIGSDGLCGLSIERTRETSKSQLHSAPATLALATDLAYYAVHGQLPAGVTALPPAAGATFTCSASRSDAFAERRRATVPSWCACGPQQAG